MPETKPATSQRPMTGREFGDCLDIIAWTQSQLADRVGMPVLRLRKMACGAAPIPLELATWLRETSAEIAEVHKRRPVPRHFARMP